MARRRRVKIFTSPSRKKLATFFSAEDRLPETLVGRFDRDFDRDIIDGARIRSPRRDRRIHRERGHRERREIIFGERKGRWLKFLGYLALAIGIASYFLPYFLPTWPRYLYAAIPFLLSIVLFFGFRFLRRLYNPHYPVFPLVLLFIAMTFIPIWNFVCNFDMSSALNWYNYGLITNAQLKDTYNQATIIRMVMCVLTIGTPIFGTFFGHRKYGGMVTCVVAVAGLWFYNWIFNAYLLSLSDIQNGQSPFNLVGAIILLVGIAALEIFVAIFSRRFYRFAHD